MTEIENLNQRFLEIEEIFEEGDCDHELIYDLEHEMREISIEANTFNSKEAGPINKLRKRIDRFKKEWDFFDAEAELDSMFPNRYDEGFDEDSMSWNSVFGDD